MQIEPPQHWMSGLDVPVTVTFFQDATARTKHEQIITLRELVPLLEKTRGPDKASLPWLKLAQFGEQRTDRGSLRFNDNVLSIHGVESDYDAAGITLERCRQIVAQADLAAIIYTSPSYTPETPKWRILCPTSCAMPPSERAGLVARLNGLFVGALAPESFTLSQSYYFGAVGAGVHHQVMALEGRPIDLASDLARGAVGRPTPIRPEPAPYVAHVASVTDGEATNYGRRALADECAAIRHAPDGAKHQALNKAAYSIGGLVAGGDIDQAFALDQLRAALSDIRHRCQDYSHAERTLKIAFEDGMRAPRQKPDRPPPAPRAMPFGIGADGQYNQTYGAAFGADEEPGRTYDAETGEIIEQGNSADPLPRPVLWCDDGAPDCEAVPVRPWVAVGYLMRGSVSVLSGQGAGGKSSLCVGLTIALATGRSMGGFVPVRPVRVVNYNVEDDQDEQRRRYLAALQAQGLTGADIAKRIMRCGPHDIGTLFMRHPETGQIVPTAAMQQLEALCAQEGVEVLICDPLAELHNAEENDNTAMRAVIAAFRAMAKRLNIAVLILHHDRKGMNAPGDMDRVRGASAISGAVRVMLTLTTMSAEEAEKFGIPADQRRRHFRIDGAKSNYAPATDADWWRLDGYQIPNGETVAAALPWQPPGVFEGLSLDTCISMVGALQRGQDGFPFAVKGQAKGSALEMMTGEPFNLEPSKAAAILATWTREGLLREVPSDSPNSRHKRLGYVVNEVKFAEMRQSAREV